MTSIKDKARIDAIKTIMETNPEKERNYVASAKQVTTEEYKLQSKLATEEGLMNIGKLMLLEEQKKQKRDDSRKEIIEILKQDFVEKSVKKSEFLYIVEAFTTYVNLTEEDFNHLKKKHKLLEEDYEELNDTADTYIEEIETWEKKFNDREVYWSGRVLTLRSKCKSKNVTISRLVLFTKFTWFLLILCICVLYYEFVFLNKSL